MSNTAEVQNSIMEELNNLTFVKDNAQKLMERKVSFERQRDKKMTVRTQQFCLLEFAKGTFFQNTFNTSFAHVDFIEGQRALHQAALSNRNLPLGLNPFVIYSFICVGARCRFAYSRVPFSSPPIKLLK